MLVSSSGCFVLAAQSLTRKPKSSQRFPAGKARIQVVPVLDALLVLLPAQKHLAAGDDGGKVKQPALDVLEENLAALKLVQRLFQACLLYTSPSPRDS